MNLDLKSVKLKTLLIYPSEKRDRDDFMPALSVPGLAGYLNSLGYQRVRCWDLKINKCAPGLKRLQEEKLSLSSYIKMSLEQPGESSLFDRVKRKIAQNNYRLVGFSVLYNEQFFYALGLARMIKKMNPGIFIVLGGPFITQHLDFIIKSDLDGLVDGLLSGDGEEPLAKLILALERKKSLSGVPNLYYKQGKRFRAPEKLFSRSISHLALPNFDDFKIKRIPLRMSLGCSWAKCTFCTYKNAHAGYCAFDPEKLVDAMETLSKKYKIKDFVFYNDNNTPLLLRKFSEALLKRKAKFIWNAYFVGMNPGFLKGDTVELMKQSGCYEAFFGLESLSDRILKLMNKPQTAELIEKVVERFSRAGIDLAFSFIYGFPTETREDILKSVNFLKRYSRFARRGTFFPFQLEKNTDIFEYSAKYGITHIDKTEKYCDGGSRFSYSYSTKRGSSKEQTTVLAQEIKRALLKKGTVFSPNRYASGSLPFFREQYDPKF